MKNASPVQAHEKSPQLQKRATFKLTKIKYAKKGRGFKSIDTYKPSIDVRKQRLENLKLYRAGTKIDYEILERQRPTPSISPEEREAYKKQKQEKQKEEERGQKRLLRRKFKRAKNAEKSPDQIVRT